jgi:hypothetical protein
MTEMCNELWAIGEAVNGEDHVVYLLASLPESYNVLVTALEANAEVPALAVVTERLLHEEAKMKSRSNTPSQEGALAARFKKKPTCYYCHQIGHIKKDCEEYVKIKGQTKPVQAKKKNKMGAFKVTITAEDENSSDSGGCSLVVEHVLSACPNTQGQWIIDSGATGHMCNKESMFTGLQPLPTPMNVILGDGRYLQAVGRGKVILQMNLPKGKKETCTLRDVLLVPDLVYNLLSITSASTRGQDNHLHRDGM